MHTSSPADQHNSATVRHRAHALCCVRRVVSSSRSYAGPHGMTAGNRSGSAAAGFGASSVRAAEACPQKLAFYPLW